MISNKYPVKAKFIKKTPKGMTYFNITDYDSKNPTDPNYIKVFATNDIEIAEDEKVIIASIESVSFKHWNGKPQVSIDAKVEHENVEPKPNVPETNQDFDTGPSVDISSDDLPF